MLKKIIVLSAILYATATTGNAQPIKTEDIRVRPPEAWQPHEKYGLNLTLGGGYLNGNVDNFSLSGSIDFDWKLNPKNSFFIQASDNYVKYGDSVVTDKTKGSILYVYSLKPRLNLFLQTTHARNKFLNIKYRTTNTAGICFHNFLEGVFKPIMVSLGLTPEYEKRSDGTTEKENRSTGRLNLVTNLTDHVKFSGDFIYMPRMSEFSDYRMYSEVFFEWKVWKETLAFRVTASDEYDSKPYLNVKKNDFSLNHALVIKMSK